jgi:RNA polymerase sigma-70 factor (ECF subfamily)
MARTPFRKGGSEARSDRDTARVIHLDRDRALVEAARRDPAAFDALYRRYLAQVYSFAFYELGHHADAEDVTERVFLLAVSGLPGLVVRARPAAGVGACTFGFWFFLIARTGFATEHRDRRRRAAASLDDPEQATDIVDGRPGLDPAERAVSRATASSAMAAIAELPADRRRALLLRFVDEMSTAEIAGVLGRSEGAVRVLIHRALRSVARDLRTDR